MRIWPHDPPEGQRGLPTLWRRRSHRFCTSLHACAGTYLPSGEKQCVRCWADSWNNLDRTDCDCAANFFKVLPSEFSLLPLEVNSASEACHLVLGSAARARHESELF